MTEHIDHNAFMVTWANGSVEFFPRTSPLTHHINIKNVELVTISNPNEYIPGYTGTVLDKELMAAMREWVLECAGTEEEEEALDELSDSQIWNVVRRAWDGGTAGFLKNYYLDKSQPIAGPRFNWSVVDV